MKKERNYDYFKVFIKMVEKAIEASKLLDDILNNFPPENLQEELDKMHEIEHDCDILMHSTMNRLVKEFLPPIEREDIINLVQTLDDITDSVEDVLMAIYMFNVEELKPEALEFSKLIVNSSKCLHDVVVEFGNFKKSKDIKDKIIRVNTLEEEGDRLYLKTIRNLYTGDEDIKTVVIWTRVIDRMEKCLDSLEEASNQMESIILKNS